MIVSMKTSQGDEQVSGILYKLIEETFQATIEEN